MQERGAFALQDRGENSPQPADRVLISVNEPSEARRLAGDFWHFSIKLKLLIMIIIFYLLITKNDGPHYNQAWLN